MRLAARTPKVEDFEAFYRCAYATFGYDDAPRQNVHKEWDTFRTYPYGLAVVVEDLDRPETERFVGYTEGVFISPSFADRAKAGVAPYVNHQIAIQTGSGKSPLLNIAQIREANSGAGVCFHIAYSGWRGPPLTAEEAFRVRAFMDSEFHKIGFGYNFREVLIEVVGADPLQRCNNAGFHLRTSYDAYYQTNPKPPTHLRPYLLSITREEAVQNDGSHLARAFNYQSPRLLFTARDQKLLMHALSGKSDEEIAVIMDRTVGNVGKRWEVMYSRAELVLPDLLPSTIDSKRGREKRRTLLAYVREHPEELRPHVLPQR